VGGWMAEGDPSGWGKLVCLFNLRVWLNGFLCKGGPKKRFSNNKGGCLPTKTATGRSSYIEGDGLKVLVLLVSDRKGVWTGLSVLGENRIKMLGGAIKNGVLMGMGDRRTKGDRLKSSFKRERTSRIVCGYYLKKKKRLAAEWEEGGGKWGKLGQGAVLGGISWTIYGS